MWVAQFYPFKNHGQLVTSGGLGTMGFGIPAAIGAKLAAPDKTVVVFVGDGGFQMTNQEMAILEEYNLISRLSLLTTVHSAWLSNGRINSLINVSLTQYLMANQTFEIS